jgi:adenine-specific DNA-methyltransferase
MKITALDGKTPDIAEENIQKLKQLFPEVFTESKVDFEKLKQVLGEYVEDSNERYNFTWNGKGRALRLSQTPSLGTLRPCKEESKDWDTTQNLYIEGDNLEVLKLLQKSYYGKVKMIYIDPPYNTGKDFVYKDDFHDSLENYKRITGQVDGNGKAISTNTETSGRYHTDWLNMMYPRLRLARNLLTDDGAIFISIDDNEIHNLRKICDEIFGEDNYIDTLHWKRKKQPSFLAKHTAKVMEYILIYGKFADSVGKLSIENISDETKKVVNLTNHITVRHFKKGVRVKIGNDGVIKKGVYTIKSMQVEYLNDVEYKNGVTVNEVDVKAQFSVSQQLIDKFIDENLLFITVNYGLRRDVSDEEKGKEKAITDLLLDWGDNQDSDKEQQEIFEGKYFDYAKPSKLIYNLIKSVTAGEGIILDFFSGSATSAHAVMQLNAEDGGNRKFIMVQLPERTDEKSEAYKAGYKNISEIGKERIRRAGEKIKEEYKDKENIENLDIGFKVFKLDTSNIRKWQPDYNNLEQSLMDYVDNFVEGRTEFDVVYEIMLKYGLDLTYPVDEFTIAGKKVYSIGYGMLMICLDNEITTEVAKGILTKIKELSPESSRVVFKDNGFKSDSNKTNIKEILKSGGIEEFITI